MLYHIKTFGCQMNEYDSERLSDLIKKIGYTEHKDGYDNCELVILNTCSIREKADAKVYSDLGRINIEKQRMLLEDNKYMIIAVIGCIPETQKKGEIFKRANFVDIVLGPQSYCKINEMIKIIKDSLVYNDKKKKLIPKITHLEHLELNVNDKFDFLNEERKSFNGLSAYISIQEGCDKFCTYCVVPNTRGRQYSRNFSDIIQETKRVAELGAKEICFLGQNVNAYLDNDKNKQLSDLIAEISNIKQIERIRYTTSHPSDVTEELIKEHKNNKKLLPYLHLPVQSGSNEILKKMNRKYTKEDYIVIIEKFRQANPKIIFSSDFIVGFPGETEKDFEETLDLIKKINYQSQCFSFNYSKRPQTIANLMQNQIPNDIKMPRLYVLQELLENQRGAFNQSCIGKTLSVLFDNKNTRLPLQLAGRSEFLQIVIINCKNENEKNSLYGKIANIKIINANINSLIGEMIN